MTLKEYIMTGGILPTNLFAMIPALQITEGTQKTFQQLFTLTYQDKEIAQETSDDMLTLYANKIEAKALQLCPFYAERIKIIAEALQEPFKKTNTRVVNNGGEIKQYDTPVDATSVESNDISSASKSTGNATETFEGISDRADKITLVVAYQDNIKNQYKMLLDDFSGLFMGVF